MIYCEEMKDQCRVGIHLKLHEQVNLSVGRFCTSYPLLTGKRSSLVTNIQLYLLSELGYRGIKFYENKEKE